MLNQANCLVIKSPTRLKSNDFYQMQNIRTLISKDKFEIAYRDDFTCQYCGSRPGNDNLEIEHLIPVSKNGSDNEENLVTACQKCNRNKSDMVAFPKSKIEGFDTIDPEWIVHRSFGAWQIKFHLETGAVLEYTPFAYWIGADRSHERDWESHVVSKRWPRPHTDLDFLEALDYFRRMTRPS